MRDPDVMMVVMINHCANPAGVVEFTKCVCAVSYTHLTLPTNAEV